MKINRIRKLAGLLTEDLGEPVEKVAIGHIDDEKEMLRKELINIKDYADELENMIERLPDNSDFPQWWQKKISMANECLSKAKHYLEGEKEVDVDDAIPDEDYE